MVGQISIGPTNLSSTESTATVVLSPDTESDSPISASTISSTTAEPPMPTNSDTTDFEHPQTTTILSTSMIAIPMTEQQEDETTLATIVFSTGISVALIAAAIGGVAGSLLVFILALTVLILLLALVWITKKHKRVAANKAQYDMDHRQEPQPEGSGQREEQHGDDEDTEMKSNDAYVSTTHLVLTTDNVAYGQATPQMTTADNVACGRIGSVVHEYDYI